MLCAFSLPPSFASSAAVLLGYALCFLAPALTPSTCLPHLQGIETDERVVLMHQAAEIFEPQTEHVYKYLQVSASTAA